jgi:hypothetical protein
VSPRRRALLTLGGGSLLLFVVLAIVGLVLVQKAVATECAELPREDLSLREMAQLRRRLEAYKDHPESPLVLTAREASFLVREQFQILAWIGIEGTEVHLETRLPDLAGSGQGRCLSVTYRGSLDVHEREARVVPTSLRLGSLDLSWLVRGREMAVPESLVTVPGPGAAELFAHVVSMEITEGSVIVQVDDPGWIR